MAIYDGNKSNYEYVMWLDADGSMPATTIKDLISLQSENLDNVIIGSRFVKGGVIKEFKKLARPHFFCFSQCSTI